MKNRDEHIINYLQDRLTSSERAALDQNLKQDVELRNEMTTIKALLDVINYGGERDLRDKLKQYESRRFLNRRIILFMSAAIILGILAIFFLSKPEIKNKNRELVALYFTPYDDPIQTRSTDDPTFSKRAFDAYRNREFVTATKTFSEAISAGDQPQYLLKFYMAISIMSSDELSNDEAISLLEDVRSGQNAYAQPSNYYLALAYLDINDMDRSEQILNEIIEEGGYYRDQASSLLSKINED